MRLITDLRGACQELRKHIDIIKVISDDIGQPAKASGLDHWWFCPFHWEHNKPSFGVHIQLQVYKCFGCHKGGDVISWTQEYHSYGLEEAIQSLASKYTVDISKFIRQPTQEEIRRNRYVNICNMVAEWCHTNLLNNEQLLSTYLNDTGFDKEQILDYGVGYCPAPDTLIKILYAKFNDITQDDIQKLELANNFLWGNTFVYPIKDQFGNALRFYAKLVNYSANGSGGKYMGTGTAHPLFTNKLLFGFNVVRKDVRNNDYSIRIVEGFKGAIAARGAAVMGTNLHQEQIDLLREHCVKEIKLGFDGDEAGQAATVRFIEGSANVSDISIKVARLPAGLQPDTIAKQYGEDALTSIFSLSVLPVQYLIDTYRDKTGAITVNEKFSIIRDIKEYLSNVSDIHLDIVSKYLSDVLSITVDSIKTYIYDIKATKTGLVNRDAELSVLHNVILDPKTWSTIKQVLTDKGAFTVSNNQYIYTAIDIAHKKSRETGNANTITAQVVKDNVSIINPQIKEVDKIIDEIVTTSPKYDAVDAANKINDLFKRRQAIDQSRMLVAMMQDVGRNTKDILSKYRLQLVSTIETNGDRPSTPIQLADSVLKIVQERMSSDKKIIGFDFSRITDVEGKTNDCLGGLNLVLSGLQTKHNIIISANSGVGKSLLALQMAISVSLCENPADQIPTLLVPLEMTEDEIMMRAISQLSGLNNTKVQLGAFNNDEWLRFNKALDRIAHGKLFVKKPQSGTPEEIFSIIDEFKFRYGIKVCVLDYIQLILAGPDDRGKSREELIGGASKMLKNKIADKLDIAQIIVAQQNRKDFKAGGASSIEQIGGSYQIAQDADDMLILIQKTPDQMKEETNGGNRKCIVDKRRGGQSDINLDMNVDDQTGGSSLRWTEKIKPEVMMGLARGVQ